MKKIEKIKKILESQADAMLVSTELSQRYLSGFDYSDGYVLITPKKAFLLADFRYIEAARAVVDKNDFEVIMPRGGVLTEVYALIRENGIKTLLIEESGVSCEQKERFEKVFEGCEIALGASKLLSQMREVKDEAELELIKKAQTITDAAFEHILSAMHPKMTEIEVALELEFFMRKNGAESVAFDTIAVSGSASSMPHGVPRAKMLEKGFLTMDFGARYNGYCADMTRTVVIGKADEEMKKLYSTVLRAQNAALDMLFETGEGANCFMLDKTARDIIDEAGYKGCFGHSLGHGIGMLVHEAPRLASSADKSSCLVRGNVTSVEPGIYLEGKYGCRIEDLVMIEHSGKALDITKSPKELIELF